MNRTIAIIITVVTALCCGLPGLGLICMAALAGMGTQMPEVMATNPSSPEEVWLGVIMFACGGLFMLVIPVVAGFVSFRMVKPEEPVSFSEPMPPAA